MKSFNFLLFLRIHIYFTSRLELFGLIKVNNEICEFFEDYRLYIPICFTFCFFLNLSITSSYTHVFYFFFKCSFSLVISYTYICSWKFFKFCNIFQMSPSPRLFHELTVEFFVSKFLLKNFDIFQIYCILPHF